MCDTCNHTTYQPVTVRSGDREETKLQQSIGLGSLVLRCDPGGKNYWIMASDDPRSAFRVYRCPTCGKNLF